MTTGSFDRLTRLRLTFNALMAERFVRRPLLDEFIDLAEEKPAFEELSKAALVLLEALNSGLHGQDFDQIAQTIHIGLGALEGGPAFSRRD